MSDQRRVFILGSGFSRQLTNGKFPTSQQLLKKLKEEVTHPALIRNIQDIPEGDEIQKILSRLELYNHISNEEKRELKKKIFVNFQKQLSVSKLYEDLETLETAKRLVKKLFKPGDTIILMNWDVVLEHILCLNGGGTKPFNYGGITEMVVSTGMSPKGEYIPNTHRPNITILKPHGSFNFLPDGTCLRALLNDMHPHFLDSKWADTSTVNLFLGYKDITQLELPLKPTKIVLPTFVKTIENSTFAKLWMHSGYAIRDAAQLLVIGYSFPPEDSLMMQTLHNGLWREKTEKQEQGYQRDLTIRWLDSETAIDRFIESSPIPVFQFQESRNNLTRYTPEKFGSFNAAYDKLVEALN